MKHILHVDLMVSDLERSLDFYSKLLGCTVADDAVVEIPSMAIVTRGHTERVRIVMLRLPGSEGSQASMIELIAPEPPLGPGAVRYGSTDRPLPSLCSFAILVPDLDVVLEELADAGVFMATPVDVVRLPRLGAARAVFVRDPDGNLVELVDAAPA